MDEFFMDSQVPCLGVWYGVYMIYGLFLYTLENWDAIGCWHVLSLDLCSLYIKVYNDLVIVSLCFSNKHLFFYFLKKI